MTYSHVPVLLDEAIHYLNPKADGKFIDCTLGGGGHTEAMLKRVFPKGKVLAIDLDPSAIEAAYDKVSKFSKSIILVKDNFKNLKQIADVHKFNKVDGILLDLGLSAGQLQDHYRGFSFLAEGKLDMRFGGAGSVTAEEIVNAYGQQDLAEIFKDFAEERLAKPIAHKIVEVRQKTKITSPQQLLDIVTDVYKKFYHGKSKINPATKIFQALRIAVNEELENLDKVLPPAVQLLAKGGRLVVISYHSLEDRIVKQFFKQEIRDCICPPEIPVCQCNHKASLKLVVKKPIGPTAEEIINNPSARSAKLRVAEKI